MSATSGKHKKRFGACSVTLGALFGPAFPTSENLRAMGQYDIGYFRSIALQMSIVTANPPIPPIKQN